MTDFFHNPLPRPLDYFTGKRDTKSRSVGDKSPAVLPPDVTFPLGGNETKHRPLEKFIKVACNAGSLCKVRFLAGRFALTGNEVQERCR